MAHTESICNVLLGIAQKHDVDCIVVTDGEGHVLVDPIYGPNAPRDDPDDPEAGGHPTSAVLSFAQAHKHLGQLARHVDGSGAENDATTCVSGQYRDHIVVQFSDGPVAVTLTSRRTAGRCLGGLLALVPVVRSQNVFKKLCEATASDS